MADFSMNYPASASSAPSRLPLTIKEALAGMWESYVSFRTYQVLKSMSDHQLEQLGLDRSGIVRAAMLGGKPI